MRERSRSMFVLSIGTKHHALIGLMSLVVMVSPALGCGEEAPLTTGLHVAITNVGWHHEGDSNWRMTGARVDVDCELQKMVVDAEGAERSATPSVDTVCAAIRKNTELLRAPSSVPSCSEYQTGTVEVTGTWETRRIDVTFHTCESAPDAGARWARLLGFHFNPPDPPA
jgi:hypothetical protein